MSNTISAAGYLIVAARALALAALGVLLSLATVAAYRLFFHPLSRVPGPTYAAISSIWQAKQVRDGRMRLLGKNLHRQYGPAVRVGPNEVWFNSEDAFRSIYSSGSGYEKSDFYCKSPEVRLSKVDSLVATSLSKFRLDWLLQPRFPDTLDLLSERDMKRYRQQRRLIGAVYQTSSLVKFEPAIDAVLERAIVGLKALDGAEVDLKEWMHIITVECLSAVVLSWSPGLLQQGSDLGSSFHSYQGWRRKSVFGLFPIVTKLGTCSKELGHAFANLWGVTYNTPEKFRSFFPDVSRRVSRRVGTALRPKPPKDDRKDLLVDLIQLHREKPAFTEDYLRRMAITNFGAGHETMTATLTSILAMVASHNDVQRRVAEEARQTDSTAYATASQLTYTQAAIKEAKRLYPVIAMSLQRTVPPNGLSVNGYFFPPGTTVGCNPVALHRNDSICGPNPELYDPSRWLDEDAARRMERHSLSWGGGARTCPGRHLAELVVFKLVPAVFAEFQVQVVMPPEDEMQSYFLSMLTGVKARFTSRSA